MCCFICSSIGKLLPEALPCPTTTTTPPPPRCSPHRPSLSCRAPHLPTLYSIHLQIRPLDPSNNSFPYNRSSVHSSRSGSALARPAAAAAPAAPVVTLPAARATSTLMSLPRATTCPLIRPKYVNIKRGLTLKSFAQHYGVS